MLDDYKPEGDEQIGVDIVKRAMEEPLRQIVNNAGEEGAFVLGKERESKNPTFGYNAQTGQFEDLVQAGVIDPTKIVRTALQNAGSISSLMLTTEALVAEIPEDVYPHLRGIHGTFAMGPGHVAWSGMGGRHHGRSEKGLAFVAGPPATT